MTAYMDITRHIIISSSAVRTGAAVHLCIGDGTLTCGEVDAGNTHAAGITFTVFPTCNGIDVMLAESLMILYQIGGTPSVPFTVAVVQLSIGAGTVKSAGIDISLII